MGIAERIDREKQARMKLIRNSAAAVFREKGFDAATIEDIASRAEISRGTIYLYFKSKDDLYYSLMQPSLDKMANLVMKIANDTHETPERKIKKMSVAVYDFYLKDPDAYHLVARYKAVGFSKLLTEDKLIHVRDMMKSNLVQCAKAVEEGIQQGKFKKVDPYLASVVFWSSFMGVIQFQEHRMMPDKRDYTRVTIDACIDWLIEGLRNH
jgi:AcrR family transcriptional regulator